MTFDVFISYPHQDKAIADAACAKLESEGIRCWIAPRDIAPSAEWAASIIEAIDQCSLMVLIFSAHANRSKQVHREVQQAFDGEKPVVPFRIENVNPEKSLRYYMGPVHWLDALTPPLEQHLQKLTASVRALVSSATVQLHVEAQVSQEKALKIDAETETRQRAHEERRRRVAEADECGTVQAEAEWKGQDWIKLDAMMTHGAPNSWFKPGAGKTEWFKDHELGPEMVLIPAGKFLMGSSSSEAERDGNEGPQHIVTFAAPFAAGRFAVTFQEWDSCIADGGCNGYTPSDEGWGRGRHPVINVSWEDAKAYVAWLSRKTGKLYRLLSEAEREYVARAETITAYWWGQEISRAQANYGSWQSVPVDALHPNPWGLYQVHGNVWEWVEDCYFDSYAGAPVDGSPWIAADCYRHVVRGGSFNFQPRHLRSAVHSRGNIDDRLSTVGFRVARTIPQSLTRHSDNERVLN
jgi:formylglycine-generating enzyme required for sulfatase activity